MYEQKPEEEKNEDGYCEMWMAETTACYFLLV